MVRTPPSCGVPCPPWNRTSFMSEAVPASHFTPTARGLMPFVYTPNPSMMFDPPLGANTIDRVVEVVLLAAAEEFEGPAGPAAAAHVHVHIGVALLDIPFDRPGFAPEE